MHTAFWVALAAMIISGIAVASQGPINARLATVVGGWQSAALISFGTGFVVLLALNMLRPGAASGLQALGAAPWWLWLGGICGIWIVCAAALSLPVLGAVTAIAALILGQVLGAMAIDAIGAFGVPQREIGWNRIAAVALVAGGVGLSRL